MQAGREDKKKNRRRRSILRRYLWVLCIRPMIFLWSWINPWNIYWFYIHTVHRTLCRRVVCARYLSPQCILMPHEEVLKWYPFIVIMDFCVRCSLWFTLTKQMHLHKPDLPLLQSLRETSSTSNSGCCAGFTGFLKQNRLGKEFDNKHTSSDYSMCCKF